MRVSESVTFAQFLSPHAQRHAWGITRRRFLATGAAATAAFTASAVFAPLEAAANERGAFPVPVPANPAFGGLHIYEVALGSEPSAIGDFDGFVGAAIVDGAGVGGTHGAREHLLFDTDMRFMKGTFRGTDGERHEGTFAFV
jgi:hypothetical protein